MKDMLSDPVAIIASMAFVAFALISWANNDALSVVGFVCAAFYPLIAAGYRAMWKHEFWGES